MPRPAQSSTMYHVTTHTALTLVPSVSPAMPVAEGNDTSVKREHSLMEIPVSQLENRTNKATDMMYQCVCVCWRGCYYLLIDVMTLLQS